MIIAIPSLRYGTIATVLILLSSGFGAADFQTHEEIGRALADETERILDRNRILNSKTFEELRDSGSRPFWEDLLLIDDEEMLNVCGLLLIESEAPDAVYDAAVRMVLNRPMRSGPVLGFAAEVIARGMPKGDGSPQLLCIRLSGSECHATSVAVLMGMLTDEDLERLLRVNETMNLPCRVLALVVDETNRREEIWSKPESEKLITTAVAKLKLCPGEARVTYLQCVDPLPPNFDDLLYRTLTNDSLSDAMTLPILYQFADSHKRVIEKASEDSAPARRAFILQFQERDRINQKAE